jgi:hypothetical protein
MKKTAKELRPGDVLISEPNRVVLDTTSIGQQINVLTAELGGRVAAKLDGMNAATLVDVEPRLSPDHVDNLLMAARLWIEGGPPTEAHRKMVRNIIDAMIPPEPPTPQELAQALAAITEYASPESEGICWKDYDIAKSNAYAILNRARRAGLFK